MKMRPSRLEFIKGVGIAAAMAAVGCESGVRHPRCGGRCRSSLRLGMAGGTYWRMKDYSFLEVLASLDLHYLSVKDWHLPFSSTDAEIRTFRNRCADLEVDPYAVGPIYMDTDELAKRTFDFARRIGARMIVGVPFERKDVNGESVRFENRELSEVIVGLCEKYDVRFALHNHGPDAPELFPDARAMNEYVKDLGPRMGFCLDIGHEFRYGGDPSAAIRTYPDRIFDIHVKNVTSSDKAGRAAGFSRGKIDLASVLQSLQEIGFDGVCAIEWERGGMLNSDFAELAESVGYFRGLADMIG